MQVASGALFLGAVVWGIVDAVYYYQPETLLGFAGTPRRRSSDQSLQVAPFLTDRAVGTGLSFRF